MSDSSERTTSDKPFNPLDKENLGISVAEALLARPCMVLPPEVAFEGAGIYAIYYVGDYPLYKPISQQNVNNRFLQPIYVGKAVPEGARKGGYGLNNPPGKVLFKRLSEHASTIQESSSLDIGDFFCRYLIVDDIWIPLGESLLIEKFSPLWNLMIDGFGNHDPGSGRYNQRRSKWDTLHPGRAWAEKLQPNIMSSTQIETSIKEYLKKS